MERKQESYTTENLIGRENVRFKLDINFGHFFRHLLSLLSCEGPYYITRVTDLPLTIEPEYPTFLFPFLARLNKNKINVYIPSCKFLVMLYLRLVYSTDSIYVSCLHKVHLDNRVCAELCTCLEVLCIE